jgi:uncharacterized protein YndB with AHSA1/START domain
MSVIELAPVVKTLELRRSAEDAFRIYVHEAAKWWPLDTHALAPENKTKAIGHVVEPRIGGRVYEVTEDGREFDWGVVLAYEPGNRFAMTWQLGRPREKSGEVEVRFESISSNTCRLTLIHTGWERTGEGAQQMREGYNSGWEGILSGPFVDYVNAG